MGRKYAILSWSVFQTEPSLWLVKYQPQEKYQTSNWASYILTSTSYKKESYLTRKVTSSFEAVIDIFEDGDEYKAKIITKENIKIISLGSISNVHLDIRKLSNNINYKMHYPSFWDKIEDNLESDYINKLFINAPNDFLYERYGFSFHAIFSKKRQNYIGLIYKIIYLL